MTKLGLMVLCAALALGACARQPVQLGPDGKPLPVAYKITPAEQAAIGPRVLGEVNRLRSASGAPALILHPQLNAAAAAHARDMSAQNRAWHFGSDGSSPIDRIQRQGYMGQLIGENISETYENDIATLSAWMQTRDTRDVIMDPDARNLGMSWFQEPSGKIWWVLLTGA
ncbi:CAP domain-containing protein [Paracoccus suum]|uniref:CAP domain-containing protein n=1 Tax=Paracoccus suum TaxID=2259340 RepID=A0A344PGN3_9RHOB|nr:CAP domain-containing protein [Paracoccus suum]AXC48538.1 CAP domain-containing protein [Paracoccus suum]